MGGCGANAINDTELDELLAKWTAPPAPLLCATTCEQNSRRASRVGSGRARHKREGECLWGHAWRRSTPIGLWPKRGRDRHRSEFPKIVDCEFLRYAGDRSPAIERVGQADRSVGAITGCDASCIVLEHYGLAWDATGLDTGSIDGTIVGQGTILNYPTVAVRPRMAGSVRMTSWMAPDLGCFALRITTEEKRPDGALRSVQEKRAALE
jgi:hypothetical protein